MTLPEMAQLGEMKVAGLAGDPPELFVSVRENSDIPNGGANARVTSTEIHANSSQTAYSAATGPVVPNDGNIWTAMLVAAAAIPALLKPLDVEEELADTALPPHLQEEGGCAFQPC